jgi:hypothetical protein
MLVVLLGAGACGSDKPASKVKGDAAGTTTTTAPGGGSTVPGGGSTSTTVKGQSGQGSTTTTTAAGGAGATSTTKTTIPATGKLTKACVRKGPTGDDQTLQVHTTPGDMVGFSTEYSDHSNELSHPAYKTGSGYGKASTSGDYEATWKVPPDAPDGTATVHWIANGKIQEKKLTFKVIGLTGAC